MIAQCLYISMAVIKILPHSHDSLGGVKGQCLKFAIIQPTEISHAIRDTCTIDMKLIKLDLGSKASVWHPG